MHAWVTFDCYGTLIDWRTGMLRALRGVAPSAAEDLLGAYHRHERTVQREDRRRTYRAVMREALRRAAAETGTTLRPGGEDVLGETLPTWPRFPATEPVLRELVSRGYLLGILSNIDDDLIARTLATFPVDVDCVITSQAVGSYKPEPGHFADFARRTGATRENWVHVGCSDFHDIQPAHRAGICSVLVDHENQPHSPAATRVVPDARTLPDIVDALLVTGAAGGP